MSPAPDAAKSPGAQIGVALLVLACGLLQAYTSSQVGLLSEQMRSLDGRLGRIENTLMTERRK